MEKRVLIIGATSAIAQAVARLYANDHCQLFLVGRNEEKIKLIKQDLVVRGAKKVGDYCCDLTNLSEHEQILQHALLALGQIDIVLIAHGLLPDQQQCEKQVDMMLKALEVNQISTLCLLMLISQHLEKQNHGTVAVLSSVAGERGRKCHYVYGAAKSAVTTFLQGLRNRFHGTGVQFVTILPGFIDTPMTDAFKKGWLWKKPDEIAPSIVKAIAKKKDIVYTPWYWRYIMLVIKSIPERFSKRMSI